MVIEWNLQGYKANLKSDIESIKGAKLELAIEAARKSLAIGCSIDDISEITGLAKKDIEVLSYNLLF